MTDPTTFAAARDALAAARAAAQGGDTDLALARAALRSAHDALTAFDRTGGSAEQRRMLIDQQRAASAALAAATEARAHGFDRSAGALARFADFTDPRTSLDLLPDHSPFVLFPVRIETRFAADGTDHRLLVRIYPDDCSVDTFDPTFSAAELTAVKTYWRATRAAGSDEGARRAAWRALATVYGSGRAAWLANTFQPTNPSGDPVFPPDPPTTAAAWSRAPRVTHFPERFVVLGYSSGAVTAQGIGAPITLPLYVGPDPGADPADSIHPDGAKLHVPAELTWMVDVDAALAAGLAVEVPLTAEQAATGFDRLLVVGVHMAQDATGGATALGDMLARHRDGRGGLALVPQGTPTHNTGEKRSGYTKADDPDASFADRERLPLFVPTDDPWTRRDGQWTAEALGVDPTLFQTVHGADGRDQAQARAMQRALWPATAGYWMTSMLAPVFSDQIVADTRAFFTEHVSGRGSVPALRIGGQPYGLLPTTAFSRVRMPGGRPGGRVIASAGFLPRLFQILRTVGQTWIAASANAPHIAAAGDAHKILLDVVGLQSGSVEFYSRYAESIAEMFNTVNFFGGGPDFAEAVTALGLETAAATLLSELGYHGAATPQILQQYFHSHGDLLKTVIDDVPLSETARIRAYTDDGRDYLTWLSDAAKTSFAAVVAEQGFTKNKSPKALLYLFLRHAIMLGYHEVSYRLHSSLGILGAAELLALRPEPIFVHVDQASTVSESRFAILEKTEPRITSDPHRLVSDYITLNLPGLIEAAEFREQLDSLAVLAEASTAQLERAFAEHVDICRYRYDAWLLGLVNLQLENLRNTAGAKHRKTPRGSYLGAYAWVENLRPAAPATPAHPEPKLLPAFTDGPSLLVNPVNGGYIHGPSLPHARSAAVLRAGHLANATPTRPDAFTVELTSGRVRSALSLLEGVRNGQSIGALLGYQFERTLHDDYPIAEIDQYIYPLRKAFPLIADALKPTATPPGVSIEQIEARNVIDGRKLVDHIRRTRADRYPFGLPGLPMPSAARATAVIDAISAAARALGEVYDAVSDLVLAESVHQAVQGNFERVAANLDAFAGRHQPPEPEVVLSPPSGISLTQRVAVHLTPGLIATAGATPTAAAEPALDAWLADCLPPLSGIGCVVTWDDPVTGVAHRRDVTLADLGIRPLDLFDLVPADHVQAMTQLDDRVHTYVERTVAGIRPDAALRIAYREAPVGALSVFETAEPIRTLRSLVRAARPLRATDAVRPGDATQERNAQIALDRNRLAGPLSELGVLRDDLQALLTTLTPLVADPSGHRATILTNIDLYLDQAVDLLARTSAFRITAGWGGLVDWRHASFARVMSDLTALVAHWTAERTVPAPTPAQFEAVTKTTVTTYSALLTQLSALPPVPAADTALFDVAGYGDRVLSWPGSLSALLAGHLATVVPRHDTAAQHLADHDSATNAVAKVDALTAGLKAMFGEDFVVVPEFTVGAATGAQWQNTVNAGTDTGLLKYATQTAKIPAPVEEWLYGVARVRPQMRAWEALTAFTDALLGPDHVPELLPAQFPYAAGDRWLALEFGDDYDLSGDHLCYTAHYSAPFDPTAAQCGLLIDEWTEVIPARDRTTGLAFHFQRPDNEPPQAILVVTPASVTGSWEWDDLVGALNDTLDLAKVRAVEPDRLDGTPYATLLPATVMATAMYAISIFTNLGAVASDLEGPSHV
ncbi:MAG TPA: hypothetical protein VI248_00155 [Kineosporiaceae bacterium]